MVFEDGSSLLPATDLAIHAAKAANPSQTESAFSPDAPDPLLGRTLGIYSIEGFLGAGAMGRVYLAKHQELHRYCALKVLAPRQGELDPAFIERFSEEGRAAAALVHPHIVTTHAIGEAGGFHFLEMEFVAGYSLQQLIREEGPLAPLRAVSIASRIADGLSLAHHERILHRDLKPENVLLTHRGVPKIADFGLAKRLHFEDGRPQQLAGTPQYMAPELFEGAPATPQSDLYSLGVCLYSMLTGRLPFPTNHTLTLIKQVSQQDVPPVRQLNDRIPLEVAECVHTLLARSPENRPRSALDALALLEAVMGQTKDLETLISSAFSNYQDIKWSKDPGCERFRLVLQLPQGRKQIAFVEPSDHAIADQLLTISSICCEAVPGYYESALRLNSEIVHGAIGIREIDDRLVFVMMDNYPRATVDAFEIRQSVLEVAHRADAIEKLLTGNDLN
jgi:eukaryotic-like serine/threonine-protein kinase